MTRDEATTVVRRALTRVAPEADVDALAPDDDLQVELGLDSVDFLLLVTEVEDRLGRAIPERDFPRLASLGRFVDYVLEADAAVVPGA